VTAVSFQKNDLATINVAVQCTVHKKIFVVGDFLSLYANASTRVL